ncbi:MAG: hypothetical protein ACTSYL_03190 [Candidatus Thorarchaeota archaeon]
METDGKIDTILDRPRGLRFIGLTQMLFGALGLVASIGLLAAYLNGIPQLTDLGLIYFLLLFFGVAVPGLVIGNYVDDLRRNAVIAQIVYSLVAVALSGYFLYWRGIGYHWTFPLFNTTIDVFVGNLALGILLIELTFALYLIVRWNKVVPPPGVKIVRDKHKAQLIERGILPSPLEPRIVGPDGQPLSPEEEQHVLEVRTMETKEGMAILCSNCGGATPISEVGPDNTVKCQYCGVTLGVSSVFVPCRNHPEFLAATTCAVCGEPFCRRCLTAQEPPVDERWKGSTIFLCEKCFNGRYRPAVTTASLVIPIDELFTQAGGRFSKIGLIYKRFLEGYAKSMRYVLEFGFRMAASMAKGSSRGGGNDDAASFLLILILIVVAIPVAVAVLMLLAGIVIIPILFYAGLISVTIQAVRIIRHTDFISLAEARERGITIRKPVHTPETPLRTGHRSWESHAKSRPEKPSQYVRDDSLFNVGDRYVRRT